MELNNIRPIQRVVVPGTFDTFHKGHKELLEFAKLLGVVIVTINGDKFSESLGKKTYDDEIKRMSNVLPYADKVYVVHSEKESLDTTIKYAPCFRLTGMDWNLKKTSKRCNVTETFWRDNNIHLIYKDRVPYISSTRCRSQKKF